MSFFSHLLGWSSIFSPDKLTDAFGKEIAGRFGWLSNVFGPILIVLWIILGLVCAAGAVYAIYVGIQLARADEQGKRDEAKKHLIYVLIAIAVTAVLIVFFNELLPLILEQVILPDVRTTDPDAIVTGVRALTSLIH